MAAIRPVPADEGRWVVTGDVVGDALRSKMSEGELSAEVRMHHPGGDDELQMFELRMAPGTEFQAHSHLEDEIIYVVDGELVLGARTLAAGSSVMIPGGTLYGFTAGPAGLRFLNMRARQDASYITRDEHMARRAATRG